MAGPRGSVGFRVLIFRQNSHRRRARVFELTRFDRPNETAQEKQGDGQTDANEDKDDAHGSRSSKFEI